MSNLSSSLVSPSLPSYHSNGHSHRMCQIAIKRLTNVRCQPDVESTYIAEKSHLFLQKGVKAHVLRLFSVTIKIIYCQKIGNVYRNTTHVNDSDIFTELKELDFITLHLWGSLLTYQVFKKSCKSFCFVFNCKVAISWILE